MTGPLGETHGKGGIPELDAVKSMTLAELGERLTKMLDSDWVEIKLVRYAGQECAVRVESHRGCALGGGSDMDSAVLQALARLEESL